jgi:uncharacterized protein
MKTKTLTYILSFTYCIFIGFSQFSYALTEQEFMNEVEKAKKGSVDAQFNLGLWFYKGTEIRKQDYNKALQMFQLAADQGDAAAQLFLGSMYHKAEGVPQDYKKAIKWYRLSAAQGNTHAQKFLKLAENQLKEEVGIAKEAKELVKGLQQDDLGEPPGQAQQQNNTKTISSVEMEIEFQKSEIPKRNKNWSRVLEIVKPLAEQGHAGSQGRLGALYLHGLGIAKNPTEGLKWLSLSAKQGDIKAEFNLGQLYQKGIGVPKDVNEAIRWLTLAADKGHKKSQSQLGIIYFSSNDGISPNDVKAFKYFSLAAKQGDKNSQFGLGILYENGVHVSKNKQEAIKWYKLAADQGHSKAKQFLEKLTKKQ